MVYLFSRLTRMLIKIQRSGNKDIIAQLAELPAEISGDLPGDQQVPTLAREARKLKADVDTWIESLQMGSTEHERVQSGNKAYAYSMRVSLDT
jgi:hypothetical protein